MAEEKETWIYVLILVLFQKITISLGAWAAAGQGCSPLTVRLGSPSVTDGASTVLAQLSLAMRLSFPNVLS